MTTMSIEEIRKFVSEELVFPEQEVDDDELFWERDEAFRWRNFLNTITQSDVFVVYTRRGKTEAKDDFGVCCKAGLAKVNADYMEVKA